MMSRDGGRRASRGGRGRGRRARARRRLAARARAATRCWCSSSTGSGTSEGARTARQGCSASATTMSTTWPWLGPRCRCGASSSTKAASESCSRERVRWPRDRVRQRCTAHWPPWASTCDLAGRTRGSAAPSRGRALGPGAVGAVGRRAGRRPLPGRVASRAHRVQAVELREGVEVASLVEDDGAGHLDDDRGQASCGGGGPVLRRLGARAAPAAGRHLRVRGDARADRLRHACPRRRHCRTCRCSSSGANRPYYGLPTPALGWYKLAEHGTGSAVDPADEHRSLAPDPAVRDRLAAVAARILPGFRSEPVAQETCLYDNTPDRDFILDRRGRLVVGAGTSGHGFKFAPLLGAALARPGPRRRAAGAPRAVLARSPSTAKGEHRPRSTALTRLRPQSPGRLAGEFGRYWSMASGRTASAGGGPRGVGRVVTRPISIVVGLVVAALLLTACGGSKYHYVTSKSPTLVYKLPVGKRTVRVGGRGGGHLLPASPRTGRSSTRAGAGRGGERREAQPDCHWLTWSAEQHVTGFDASPEPSASNLFGSTVAPSGRQLVLVLDDDQRDDSRRSPTCAACSSTSTRRSSRPRRTTWLPRSKIIARNDEVVRPGGFHGTQVMFDYNGEDGRLDLQPDDSDRQRVARRSITFIIGCEANVLRQQLRDHQRRRRIVDDQGAQMSPAR